MANTLTITACDNELVLIAYTGANSYQIADIKSGNNEPVNFTISLQSGQYTGPLNLNGVTAPLSGNYNVYLASGAYTLVATGINWGGPQAYAVSLNGVALKPVYTNPEVGVVWVSSPVSLQQ
ncbi:hypothetical protein [Chromobacterium alticapitis]|uniref:Uncharacterized protein n=1 Tax=Chromobacterium alticapitis TaxID=2073169 RepID=A0A2S5DE41_9NEIS|nr:hypothetical protein [Chromobacterium alticapitis]POZ61258.1 hypothetical protein C2I19_14360 [Chromobacterium alticapitis]